jgi:hypothetical protein
MYKELFYGRGKNKHHDGERILLLLSGVPTKKSRTAATSYLGCQYATYVDSLASIIESNSD